MTGLVGAVQFLTRVPIRTSQPVNESAAVPWFPIVGVLIGVGGGGVAVGLGELVPASVAAAVAVVAVLILTGAFHEDGLADTADAFGGGSTTERRLEILKDPRHGSYGVAALAGSIVLRVVCVASIVDPAAVFAAFVASHAFGRAAAVAAMAAPPARDEGLGASAGRAVQPWPAGAGIVVAAGFVTLIAGWWVLPLAAAATVGAALVVLLAVRKIGGTTGDVLGAVEQVAECLVLATVTGLAARHFVWWS